MVISDMKISIKSAIDFFSKKTRNLFLLDGSGAALTTCTLFFVLRHYSDNVGIPKNVLMYLSVVGLVCCAYSIACCLLLDGNWTPYLRVIATINLLYCMLTLTMLCFYINRLTKIGWAYFLSEVFVIGLLVYIELSVATRLAKVSR